MAIGILRAGRAAAAVVGGAFLVSGFSIAPVLAAPARVQHSPCASGSAAAFSAVPLAALGGGSSAGSVQPSASASPSSTSPLQSPSPSLSPGPSGGTSPSNSPSPSTSPSPTTSSSPSTSPSPSPTSSRSHSPSPSPSPSRSRHAGVLCVTAQIVRHQSQASPGGVITYSIWVWSTVKARRVTASVAANLKTVRVPKFTLCPTVRNTACSIGSLSANQALELLITDRVRTSAATGRQITLTVTVTGANLSPAVAAITTVVGQLSPSPGPSTGPALPPSFLPTFPTTTVTPGSLSSLFPVVTASPPTAGGGSHHQSSRLAGVTSSAVPLDPRLIGGQLAGLAVLAAAITMAVARLSLRTAQPAAAPGSAAPATPAGPVTAAAAGAAAAAGTAGAPDGPAAGTAAAPTGPVA